MTQEEKSLLLQDLCGRLPYGVKVQVYYEDIAGFGYYDETVWLVDNDEPFHVNDSWIEDIKPYLRPMSSMTEEEEQEYYDLTHQEADDIWGKCLFDKMVDFCNKRHLDFRGLIGKELALEAPENMYKI